MSSASVAAVYAQALLELADERGARAAVVEDCRQLAAALHEQPRLLRELDDPKVAREQAKAVIAQAFAGKLRQETLDLLRLLVDRGRLGEVRAIARAVVDRAERAASVVHVTATTAEPMGAGVEGRLVAGLRTALGPGAVLHARVDPTLIGGLTLRIDDTLVDGSVRRQLAEMKNLILESPVRSDLWDEQPEGATT